MCVCVSWFGHTFLKERNALNQIVKWSSWLIESQLFPAFLYSRQLQRIASTILNDDIHPLNFEFQLLPSRQRYLVPKCKTKLYMNSFIPVAIIELNKCIQCTGLTYLSIYFCILIHYLNIQVFRLSLFLLLFLNF